MFIRVVFPAPFSPSNARTCPELSVKLTSSFATSDPNRLPTPEMRRAGVRIATEPSTGIAGRSNRRFRFSVIHFHNEAAITNSLLAFCNFRHDVRRHLALEGTERRQRSPTVLHHAERTIVFCFEGSFLDLGDHLVDRRFHMPER